MGPCSHAIANHHATEVNNNLFASYGVLQPLPCSGLARRSCNSGRGDADCDHHQSRQTHNDDLIVIQIERAMMMVDDENDFGK